MRVIKGHSRSIMSQQDQFSSKPSGIITHAVPTWFKRATDENNFHNQSTPLKLIVTSLESDCSNLAEGLSRLIQDYLVDLIKEVMYLPYKYFSLCPFEEK